MSVCSGVGYVALICPVLYVCYTPIYTNTNLVVVVVVAGRTG